MRRYRGQTICLGNAIQIQSRLGSVASGILRGNGYEEFVPLYRSQRRWSDRIKELELPLFPGYLFCRFDVEHIEQTLN